MIVLGREGKERKGGKGKERKGKERKGKERKGKERKEEFIPQCSLAVDATVQMMCAAFSAL